MFDVSLKNIVSVDRFLGHFQPQLGKPAIWEMDFDHHSIGRFSSNLDVENMRYLIYYLFLKFGWLRTVYIKLENIKMTYVQAKNSEIIF